MTHSLAAFPERGGEIHQHPKKQVYYSRSFIHTARCVVSFHYTDFPAPVNSEFQHPLLKTPRRSDCLSSDLPFFVFRHTAGSVNGAFSVFAHLYTYNVTDLCKSPVITYRIT